MPDETDDINVPLRTPAYIPHTTPGAAENPQKHTKQRPASALTLAATPAIPSCHQTAVLHPLHGSHCSPVTRTDTRVQTNLLCTNRDIISTFLGRTCCLCTGASTCTSKSSVRRASNLQPPTMDRERSLYRPPRNALCSTVVVRLRFSGGLELVPSHTRNTRVALSPFVPYRRSNVLFVVQDFTPISGIVVRRSLRLAPTTAPRYSVFSRVFISNISVAPRPSSTVEFLLVVGFVQTRTGRVQDVILSRARAHA